MGLFADYKKRKKKMDKAIDKLFGEDKKKAPVKVEEPDFPEYKTIKKKYKLKAFSSDNFTKFFEGKDWDKTKGIKVDFDDDGLVYRGDLSFGNLTETALDVIQTADSCSYSGTLFEDGYLHFEIEIEKD